MRRFKSSRFSRLVSVVFLMGAIVIPTLHLIFHALPHDHTGGGIHYQFTPDAREETGHPDEGHGHGTAEGTHHHHESGPAEGEHRHEQKSDPRHGQGSAAHFSLAFSDAVATCIAPSFFRLIDSAPIEPTTHRPTLTAHFSVQRFRGPPARG